MPLPGEVDDTDESVSEESDVDGDDIVNLDNIDAALQEESDGESLTSHNSLGRKPNETYKRTQLVSLP